MSSDPYRTVAPVCIECGAPRDYMLDGILQEHCYACGQTKTDVVSLGGAVRLREQQTLHDLMSEAALKLEVNPSPENLQLAIEILRRGADVTKRAADFLERLRREVSRR